MCPNANSDMPRKPRQSLALPSQADSLHCPPSLEGAHQRNAAVAVGSSGSGGGAPRLRCRAQQGLHGINRLAPAAGGGRQVQRQLVLTTG